MFPFWANAVVGLALVVLMIARCTSATAIRAFWKKTRFISQKSGRYRPYSGPNSKVLVRVNKLGVLPLLRSKMGCIEFHGFILYWWILNIRSEIKVCEGKGKLTVLSSNQSSLKTKQNKKVLQGWNGLALYFCSWPCVYLRRMSLKWMPQESKTCVTIKKMPVVWYSDSNRCQNIKVKFSYTKRYSHSLIHLMAERFEPHITRLWLYRLKWKSKISLFFFLYFF